MAIKGVRRHSNRIWQLLIRAVPCRVASAIDKPNGPVHVHLPLGFGHCDSWGFHAPVFLTAVLRLRLQSKVAYPQKTGHPRSRQSNGLEAFGTFLALAAPPGRRC